MSEKSALDPAYFAREDESDDAQFYAIPRMVTHIDDLAIEALGAWIRENIPPGSDVLDLMSSCVSHLPGEVRYGRIAGLGMNGDELEANPQLTERVVHDLTKDPALPFADRSFDVCLITVSVQYLVHPLAVFAEIARVLRPGGMCAVSFSNRMFPTKAIALWRATGDADHGRIVGYYFTESLGFGPPEFANLSPNPGESDPLYLVYARTAKVEPGDPVRG